MYDTRADKCSAERDNTQKMMRPYVMKSQLIFEIEQAFSRGNVETIKEYFYRRNVNNLLDTGWTPLLYAALYVQPTIMKYLLSEGADPYRHIDGVTPLTVLCNSTKGSSTSFLSCLTLLVEAKVNINVTNKHKETALMLACKSREASDVQGLLKYVNNINARDSNNRTALFYAVSANKCDTVILLLENGADAAVIDWNGITALEIAVTKGYTKIQLLLERESNPATELIHKVKGWEDIFPFSDKVDNDTVHREIERILDGMGLPYYRKIFCGVGLRTFFRLTECDLKRLGMDISIHRKQFMDNVFKLHSRRWYVQSIGTIDSSNTIYDWIASLGNMSRQIIVMGGSFDYIAKSLMDCIDKDTCLGNLDIDMYEEQLERTGETLINLKKELLRFKAFAQKIKAKQRHVKPGEYIEPRSKSNWNFIPTVALLLGGIYLYTRLS